MWTHNTLRLIIPASTLKYTVAGDADMRSWWSAATMEYLHDSWALQKLIYIHSHYFVTCILSMLHEQKCHGRVAHKP